ncbi:MAG: zinc ribbon domain-containing protein [Syntrophales bacterium]
MPIYEYKCKKCGEEFEVFHKMTDNDVKSCKHCRGPVNKLISRTSFQLQGSGWYVTDYGGKKPELAEGKATGSNKDEGASETSTKQEKVETTTVAAENNKSS